MTLPITTPTSILISISTNWGIAIETSSVGIVDSCVGTGRVCDDYRTTTVATVQIEERSDVRQDIVPSPTVGYRRCQVSYKARIGAEWYLAQGVYDWSGNAPDAEACGVAQSRADASVRTQVAPTGVRSESTMVCTDRPNMDTLRKTVVGTQGRLHQFRPHPDYPREFWHNGTRCRWFLDTEWAQTDVVTRQGISCIRS